MEIKSIGLEVGGGVGVLLIKPRQVGELKGFDMVPDVGVVMEFEMGLEVGSSGVLMGVSVVGIPVVAD